MGIALVWLWGLCASRILQIPFKESKGEETTKSPQVWPSESSLWGAKISGDPVQSVCCHNDGWLLHIRILSCSGGYAFLQVQKNLK